jgi:GNAT superfamily N-acetyltransferase
MIAIEATKEHLFIIQALSDKIWPQTFQDILSKQQIEYMMDMMYSTSSLEKQMDELNHHYLLVDDAGEYVGYTSYELNYKGTATTKIHKIYILPSLQGKGIGRFLIDTIGEIARNNNNNALSLNVNRFNKALDFYKRIGFDIVDREDINIGNGFLMEDFVLNKKLID